MSIVDVGRANPVWRCTRCKKKRSIMSELPVTRPVNGYPGAALTSFFSSVGANGQNFAKVDFNVALSMLYLWSEGMRHKQIKGFLRSKLGTNNITVTDWLSYIREALKKEFDTLPPLAGPGRLVEIDESYLRGRRKNNQGRLMGGNAVPVARANYGAQVVGPWVFGLIERTPNGKRDIRAFFVNKRDRLTLQPLVEANILPGTRVHSDQWAAYASLSEWGGGYDHHTVNHSENFVNPEDGTHTQTIERAWRDLKTRLLRLENGVRPADVPSRLAEYRFLQYYKEGPFWAFLDILKRQFPV
jgi:hypothetical protein